MKIAQLPQRKRKQNIQRGGTTIRQLSFPSPTGRTEGGRQGSTQHIIRRQHKSCIEFSEVRHRTHQIKKSPVSNWGLQYKTGQIRTKPVGRGLLAG